MSLLSECVLGSVQTAPENLLELLQLRRHQFLRLTVSINNSDGSDVSVFLLVCGDATRFQLGGCRGLDREAVKRCEML